MNRDDLFSVSDGAPAVFDAEHESVSQREQATPPEVVYVPSELVETDQGEIVIQLGRTEDNEFVLLGFSSPVRMAACFGGDQPWIAVSKSEIECIRERCEAAFIEIDPVRPRLG